MFLDSLTKANELDQYGFVLTFVIVSIGVIASILTFTYALYMIKETFWGKYNIESLNVNKYMNHGYLVYQL